MTLTSTNANISNDSSNTILGSLSTSALKNLTSIVKQFNNLPMSTKCLIMLGMAETATACIQKYVNYDPGYKLHSLPQNENVWDPRVDNYINEEYFTTSGITCDGPKQMVGRYLIDQMNRCFSETRDPKTLFDIFNIISKSFNIDMDLQAMAFIKDAGNITFVNTVDNWQNSTAQTWDTWDAKHLMYHSGIDDDFDDLPHNFNSIFNLILEGKEMGCVYSISTQIRGESLPQSAATVSPEDVLNHVTDSTIQKYGNLTREDFILPTMNIVNDTIGQTLDTLVTGGEEPNVNDLYFSCLEGITNFYFGACQEWISNEFCNLVGDLGCDAAESLV